MKVSLIFVAIVSVAICHRLSDELKMISELIHSYKKPTSVLIYECWKPSKRLRLVLELVNIKRTPKNVRFIQKVDEMENIYTKKDLFIVLDLNCYGSREFLEQANFTYKLRSPYRWLIIGYPTNNYENILHDLNDLSILIDSEVFFSVKDGKYFKLYLVYKLESNSNDWRIETYGDWSERGLLKTAEMNSPVSMRRKNLRGFPIAASVVVSCNETKTELLTLNFKYSEYFTDFVSKASYRQVHPLFDFMNATRVLVFTDNWGYIVNGSYNGMIGDLSRGVAELTGTVIFITTSRLDILDYLAYPSSSTVKFVFRQPSLSYQNNLFVLPFKPKVWLCIVGLVILMLFIVFINAHWENIKLENNDVLDRTYLRPNLSEISLMIIGAVTQQGSFTELKGTLGRVVMFLMFLLFLFLYTSYSANIVALLQSSSNEIKTLSDLLNSKLELGVEDTPYNRHHFSTAKEPVKKAIYEKKIAPRGSKPNFISLEEGVKRLQKKPFAFNMVVGGGYRYVERYFLEHEKCGLQEIEYIQENKPWQTCRKNSPFKEIFKIGLLRNGEHGLNDRVNRMIYAKKPTCIVHGGIFDSVNMTDFYPALLMLLYGMILALFLIVVEILHSRRIHTHSNF